MSTLTDLQELLHLGIRQGLTRFRIPAHNDYDVPKRRPIPQLLRQQLQDLTSRPNVIPEVNLSGGTHSNPCLTSLFCSSRL
jgi:hypothetical protein